MGSASGFFNGKDLDGWEGLTKYWSVKDGAIVGYTPEDPKHQHVPVQQEEVRRLRAEVQDSPQGRRRQQRRADPQQAVEDRRSSSSPGRSATSAQGYWGSLYGERFGGMMKQSPPDLVKKAVKQKEFNDYSIKCVGKHVTIKINGETMVDGDFPKMPDEGIIAWQLHAGFKSMEVTFKDIQFKDLSKK